MLVLYCLLGLFYVIGAVVAVLTARVVAGAILAGSPFRSFVLQLVAALFWPPILVILLLLSGQQNEKEAREEGAKDERSPAPGKIATPDTGRFAAAHPKEIVEAFAAALADASDDSLSPFRPLSVVGFSKEELKTAFKETAVRARDDADLLDSLGNGYHFIAQFVPDDLLNKARVEISEGGHNMESETYRFLLRGFAAETTALTADWREFRSKDVESA